jgi:hypothetical protein
MEKLLQGIDILIEEEQKRQMIPYGGTFNSDQEAWAVTDEEVIEVYQALIGVQNAVTQWREAILKGDKDIQAQQAHLNAVLDYARQTAAEAIQVAQCAKKALNGVKHYY